MHKKYPLSALLAVGLLMSACNHNSATAKDAESTAQPAPAKSASASSGTDALVRVNDDVISKNLFALFFTERQRKRPAVDDSPQQQVAMLNELTNFMLISQDAEAQRLDQHEGVRAALKLQRLNLLARLAIQNRLKGKTPSDQELKQIYEERFTNGPSREYKARHILLKTEDEAKAVIAELDEGADFSELARSKSTGPSAATGGDLGWFGSSKMVKPFAEAVMVMDNGSHSTQPVKTKFGWHVILREDSRDLPPPTFDDAKKTILTEIQQKALQDYINELRQKASVEFVGKQTGAAQ